MKVDNEINKLEKEWGTSRLVTREPFLLLIKVLRQMRKDIEILKAAKKEGGDRE